MRETSGVLLCTSTYIKKINGLINSCQCANGRINSVLKLNNSKHARKKWNSQLNFNTPPRARRSAYTPRSLITIHPPFHTVHYNDGIQREWASAAAGFSGVIMCADGGDGPLVRVSIIGPGQHGPHHSLRSITHVTKMGGTLT